MATTATYGTLSASEHSSQLRKAVIAATIGTAIEWYDFFIYGTAAGLIFGKLYFPNEDPLTGTLAAFGTYFIGFVGRPIGAAIFGHYGDRIGRKATLIATLLCMGIATFLVAFVPTYESIGIWGAVILTVLRMIQGIGVGGEWGGSVLLAMEWSRHHGERGLVASWPQFGVPCGLFLSNLAILAVSTWTGDAFATWGWRIPFALSIVLVGVGLWIRLGILETPVFQQLLDKNKIERAPITGRQATEEVIPPCCGCRAGAFYLHRVHLRLCGRYPEYVARPDFGGSRGVCVSFVTIPLSGHISDRIGRRRCT
jgi:MFS family permease